MTDASSSGVADTLYAQFGSLLGLEASLRSEVDLIDQLDKGLAVSTVKALRAGAVLTDEETFELIAPRRNLSRREALGQALSRLLATQSGAIAVGELLIGIEHSMFGRGDSLALLAA